MGLPKDDLKLLSKQGKGSGSGKRCSSFPPSGTGRMRRAGATAGRRSRSSRSRWSSRRIRTVSMGPGEDAGTAVDDNLNDEAQRSLFSWTESSSKSRAAAEGEARLHVPHRVSGRRAPRIPDSPPPPDGHLRPVLHQPAIATTSPPTEKFAVEPVSES